ncbi:hypothetical protein Ddye_023004 [Dipteronia dyeriana]|uniref:Uncharacterized protein n=1 Tax=Dipteronia dyeriana TaxID=168575 RepID=A0AAD9TSR4_9ROSI|nr:hypothetical protein Ddye_023004 [Dipteronia dyeriana]
MSCCVTSSVLVGTQLERKSRLVMKYGKNTLSLTQPIRNFRQNVVLIMMTCNKVVGVGTATGNDSMALGADDTDASILENEENTIYGMEKFPFDATNNAFIAPQNNIFDESFQPQSLVQPSSQFEALLGSMFNKEKTGQRKRSKTEYEGISSSNGTNNHTRVLDNLFVGIDSISTNFERIYNLMEKRKRERQRD